jgi:hypothetical protein
VEPLVVAAELVKPEMDVAKRTSHNNKKFQPQ